MSVPGDAGGSFCIGVGETVGISVAVPVSAGVLIGAGMGAVWGISGAEVSGWIGMGVVLGASWTGVALGPGASCTGDSGTRLQAEMKAARNSRRTFFMMVACRSNIMVVRGSASNNFHADFIDAPISGLIHPAFEANIS